MRKKKITQPTLLLPHKETQQAKKKKKQAFIELTSHTLFSRNYAAEKPFEDVCKQRQAGDRTGTRHYPIKRRRQQGGTSTPYRDSRRVTPLLSCPATHFCWSSSEGRALPSDSQTNTVTLRHLQNTSWMESESFHGDTRSENQLPHFKGSGT